MKGAALSVKQPDTRVLTDSDVPVEESTDGARAVVRVGDGGMRRAGTDTAVRGRRTIRAFPRRRTRNEADMRLIPVKVKATVAAALCGLLLLTPTSPVSAATEDEESCFIIASYRIFWRSEASFEAFAHWFTMFEYGEPYGVLPEYLATQEPWLGVAVDDLYRKALDRGPDASGRLHWIERLEAGALVNTLGSQIYGSEEFYRRAGSTPEGFITDLYARILHRMPEPAGLTHWVGQLGATSRGAVAAEFFASPESRSDRVTALYASLLGREPDPAGLSYWQGRLLTVNDVRLAVMLASSPEFFARTSLSDGSCLNPL